MNKILTQTSFITRLLGCLVIMMLLWGSASAQYCASNATSSADTRINNVTLGTLNNTSPATCQTYTDYTGVAAPVLIRGNSYSGSVTQGTCGGSFSSFVKVFIDYNQNLIFEEPGELAWSGSSPGNLGVVSGTPIIPVTALTGNTRMRVVLREGGSATSTLACGTYTWGETEDYTVNIQNPTISYCASNATSSADTRINNVSLGSLNNASPATCQTYTNYTTVTAPNLVRGSSYAAAVQQGTCGGSFGSFVEMYIDYNKNGIFEEPSEIVMAGSSAGNLAVVSGTVNIPLTASLGLTGMRVVLREGGSAATTTPCGTYTWGETEDYLVNISLPPTYCTSNATSTADTRINNVTLGTLNNNSPNTCQTYTDYTGIAAPNLVKGSSYTGSITQGTCGGSFAAYTEMYIDYNQDGVFSEPSEIVLGGSSPGNGGIVSGSVLIPATASTGLTRMRVVLREGGSAATTVPCGTYTWGETEDYMVNITNPLVYCNSNATSTADEEIFNVTFGSLSNTSNCATLAPGPGSLQSRYSNYVGFAPVPVVAQNQVVPFSLTLGYCGSTAWSNMAAIYIDYNQNGTFDLPSEQVYTKPYGSGAYPSFVVSGNITIPATASVGITRMRVVYVESTVVNPCGTYTWGETEDYNIEIIAPTNCSGAPAAANALASASSVCPSTNVTLSLSTTYTLAGITYQWQSSPNASFSPATNLGTAATQVATQTAATYYRCIISCSFGSSTTSGSVLVNMNNFLSCYCNPGYSFGCSFPDQISNVTFAGINNNTGCGIPGANPPPQIFTTPNPTIQQCESYPLSVTTSGDVEGVSVWFDWNQNGIFEMSERVLHSYAGTNPATYTALVTVPQTAVLGTTMMRVRCTYAGLPPDDPCASVTYGEVENYYVTIGAGGPPVTPLATAISGPATGICNQTLNYSIGSGYVGAIQWQFSLTSGGPYTDITGATAPTQPLVANGPATFYLRVRFSGSGCPLPAPAFSPEYQVVIGAPPVTITSTEGNSFCRGVTTTLSTGAAGPWAWNTGQTTQSITVTPLVNTLYTVTTGTGLCQGVGNFNIDILGGPIATSAAAPTTTECPGATKTLTGTLIPGLPGSGYNVASIPFAPLPTAGTSVSLSDDAVSGALPIGFTFTFFGNNYTNAYISSNGFITFNAGSPNGCCTGQNIPNAAAPNNLIAMYWEDLNPGAGGTITYSTQGSAPNRIFVVSFNGVPHFGGGNLVTGQIQLREGSNIIEIHGTALPSDGGNHTQGIENSAGNSAYTLPGRNSANWSAFNDGVRFSPNLGTTFTYVGPVTYSWVGTNGFTANTATASDNPMATTTYTLTVADDVCSSSSTVLVEVHPEPTVSTFTGSPFCEGNPVEFFTDGTGAATAPVGGTLTVTVSGTGFLDETSWQVRNYLNVPIASGGPYGFGTTNTVTVSPSASDYPITFFIETQGSFNDNIANYSVVCNANSTTLTSGTLAGGGTFTSSPYSCGSGGGGLNYSWTGPSGFSSTAEDPYIATSNVGQTGMYYVTLTDGNGCTAEASTFVQVNENPSASLITMTPVSCTGFSDGSFQVFSFTGTPFFQFTELNTFNTNFTGYFDNLSDGTYYVEVSDINGCQSVSPLAVTVTTIPNAPPVISCPANISVNNDPGICGAVVTYATPVGTDVCPIIGTVQTAGLPSGSVFPIGTTVNTFRVTDVEGLFAECSFSVTVTDNELPTITNVPANFSACNPISWTPPTITDNCPGVSIVSSHAPGSNFPFGTTTVTYTATDVYGQVSTASFNVTRYEESVAASSISSNRDYNNICLGENITMTVVGGSLGEAASWKWYTGSCGGTLVGTGPSLTASPTSTITYYVRAEGLCNTTACAQIIVVVSTAPPSQAVVYNTVPSFGAPGITSTLSVNPVPGATYYRWFTNNGQINGVLFNGQISPVQTTVPTVDITFVLPQSNYQIRVMAGNACGRTQQSNTHVRGTVEAPTSLTGPTLACPGQTLSYTVSAVSGTNTTYNWQLIPSSAGTISGTGLTRQVTFAAGFTTAQLCVNGISNFGLPGAPICIVISTNAPTPGAVSGLSTPCEGSTHTYSIAAVAGATSYNWSSTIPGVSIVNNGTSADVTFPANAFSGDICVTANSACGVSAASCKAVTSGAPGVPGPISGPTQGICGASNVNYSLSTSDANSYQWNPPAGVTISGAGNLNSVNLNFGAGFTSGTIEVIAYYDCGSASSTISVNGAPNAPVITPATICAGTTELYFASSTGATGYSWSVSGALYNQCTNPPVCSQQYIEWGAGGGSFSVTASNTCGTSAPFNLSTNCRVSDSGELDTKVYPNPTTGEVTVEFTSYAGGTHQLTVTDLSGRVVLVEEIKAASGLNRHDMDLGFANKGLYMLYVKDQNGKISVTKVAVE